MGDTVGEAVGLLLGCGVGTPYVRVRVMPEAVAVAAFDITTFFEVLVIDDTVVSSAMVVPTTVIPTTT